MAGTELAKAYVQIIPSAQGIKGKLTTALGGEASSAGDSAGKTAGASIGAAIKKAIAAAGIGAALKSAISEGAALEQSIGGIETLFKDSADKVIENAKIAYKTAGMSANEYMETVTGFSASLLQGLAGDTNKAADVADMALTDMSDNANKMGTSMESIQNAYQGFAKQNYTMLDNLKLGYGGTKTEMQRLLADAQKLTGVKYDLDNLSDVYTAIHVIQEEMDITGTTAKEAASTLSGSLASVKSALKNVLGNLALGKDIRPALEGLITTVRTFIVGNLIPMVKNVLSSLPDVIGGIGTMIVGTLANTDYGELTTWAFTLIGNIVTSIIAQLPYIAEAAVGIARSIGETIVNTDWVSVISEMMENLKNAILVSIGECFGGDYDEYIEGMFGFLINGVPAVAQIIQDAFTLLWDGVQMIWETVGAPIFDAITSVMQYLADNWGSISETIKTLFQTAWDFCGTVWTNVGQPIWDMISFAIDSLASMFAEHMPAIMGFFQEAIAGIKDTWEKHLKPIFEAIGAVLNEVVKPAFEFVWKVFIEPLIKNVFGHIADLWKNSLKPIFDGICDFLLGAFTNDWKKSLEGIFNIVKGVFNAIREAVERPMDLIKDIVKNAIDFIKEKFDFDWKFPDIKLPHFRITGEFSLSPPSVPSFGIDWYAKAMNDPMIMTSPTAFGVNALGQIMAGGEKGSEVISGTDTLMKMIASAVSSQNSEIVSVLIRILNAIVTMDENMGDNVREGMSDMVWKINSREAARFIKAVT